ncbi:MAG: exosome complex RNA-binding protein Rrp4 [Candidatus Nanohaloarchaea archaeon]
MSKVKEEKDLVAPGDVVYEGDEIYPNSGVYQEDGKIISKYTGLVQYGKTSVRVVPMSGRYIPGEGDIVIGEVSSVGYSNWRVDLNSPYEGMLKIDTAVDEYIDLDEDDLTDYYDVGDAIVVEVSKVTEGYDVNLSMEDRRCRKLRGGRIIQVYPSKVPRVIGKKGTMVKQIKSKTDCKIIVGQNGLVWISGDKANLAARAIKKVEKEAHTSGLTDRIGEWLDEQLENNEVNE